MPGFASPPSTHRRPATCQRCSVPCAAWVEFAPPAGGRGRQRKRRVGRAGALRLAAVCLTHEAGRPPAGGRDGGGGGRKRWDVIALGNLCVDIVVPMDPVRCSMRS